MSKHEFLSEEWIAAAQEIREEYAGSIGTSPPPMKMNVVITDVPFGEGAVDAHIDTTDGEMSLDIGHIDAAGWLQITDRMKDVIKTGGEWTSSLQIEDVVAQLEGVLECAAVGIADEKTGEAVKLVIVRKNADLTEAQVRAFCRENLTGYKRPARIEFRTDMPKTPVGKILRRELRDKT